MKTPEEIASELVQKHVQWEEDAECFPQWHVDRSALLISIATAIRMVPAPVEVSEKELTELVTRHCETSPATDTIGIRQARGSSYLAGFRKAMRMNAVARLDWPSEKEIAQAYDAKRAAVGGRGNTIHMMTGWLEACNWLRKRLMGEGG